MPRRWFIKHILSCWATKNLRAAVIFLVPPLKPCDEFWLIAHERGNRSAG